MDEGAAGCRKNGLEVGERVQELEFGPVMLKVPVSVESEAARKVWSLAENK